MIVRYEIYIYFINNLRLRIILYLKFSILAKMLLNLNLYSLKVISKRLSNTKIFYFLFRRSFRHVGRSTTPRNQLHENFVINYLFPSKNSPKIIVLLIFPIVPNLDQDIYSRTIFFTAFYS